MCGCAAGPGPGERRDQWPAHLAFYAALTPGDDGRPATTRTSGETLAARPGPTLYATEDPEDDSPGYGGP